MDAVRQYMLRLKAAGNTFTSLEDVLENGLTKERRDKLNRHIAQWKPKPAVMAAFEHLKGIMRAGVLPPGFPS
jgi:hypothetical protein